MSPIALCFAALSAFTGWAGAQPETPAPELSEGGALARRAEQAYNENRYRESVALYERARAAFREDGDMPNWADSSRNEAISKMDAGDHAGSAELLDQVVAYRRKGGESGAPALAAALVSRAKLELSDLALDRSVADSKEGAALLEKYAPDDPALSSLYLMAGAAEEARDRFREAGFWFEKAVAFCRRNRNAQSYLSRALSSSAANLARRNRFKEALEAIRRAQASDDEGPGSPSFAVLLGAEADILMRSNRLVDAEKLVRSAVGDLEKSLGPDTPTRIPSVLLLCEIELKRKSYSAAASCLNGVAPSIKPDSAFQFNVLKGAVDREFGRFDRAGRELDLARASLRNDPSTLPLARISYERGLLDMAEGKTLLARKELSTALSRRGAVYDAEHPEVQEVRAALSKLDGAR